MARTLINRMAQKIARYVISEQQNDKHEPFRRARGDSFDILEFAFIKAAAESAEFYESNLLNATAFSSDLELLTHAVGLADRSGLCLEFGVATGRTISHLAELWKQPVYGFDSFKGLPEDWRTGYAVGAFGGARPQVPDNVELVEGWFSETLPRFLERTSGTIAFLHIDCDLYSSTKTVLDGLNERIKPGCVIVFDEYLNYPGWKLHEHRALTEFVSSFGTKVRYVGFVPSHQQVCVVVE